MEIIIENFMNVLLIILIILLTIIVIGIIIGSLIKAFEETNKIEKHSLQEQLIFLQQFKKQLSSDIKDTQEMIKIEKRNLKNKK